VIAVLPYPILHSTSTTVPTSYRCENRLAAVICRSTWIGGYLISAKLTPKERSTTR
jgi:hypothetical protein